MAYINYFIPTFDKIKTNLLVRYVVRIIYHIQIYIQNNYKNSQNKQIIS